MKELMIGLVISLMLLGGIIMMLNANNDIAAVTPQLKTPRSVVTATPAKPGRQINTKIEKIGLSAQQQQNYQAIKAAYGQQRKHLLQQRKQLSGEDYRQQLTAIKTQHQQQLTGLMSEQQYRLYHQLASRKRGARDKHLEKERETHRH